MTIAVDMGRKATKTKKTKSSSVIIRQKVEQLYLEERWFDHGLLSAVLRELKSLAVMHKAVHVYAFEIPSADPEGGDRGSGPPWKITSCMGFYRE